jgi:hypothetical protein
MDVAALLTCSESMMPITSSHREPVFSESAAGSLVVVQRDWNGWRKAMVPFNALEGVHWRRPTGAPRPLIFGYVSCDSLLSGEIPHECGDATAPHRLLVCVLKCHTGPSVFQELVKAADRGSSLLGVISRT